MEPGESSYKDQRSQFPYAFTAGLIIVAILVAVIVLVVKHTRTAPVAEVKLPYGAAEQAYSDRIHFDDIKLAHATNFLNQDFTYVAGTVANMGDKDIKAIQVQIEFRNTLDQVVLRENESLIPPDAEPIPAGQRRDFQVTLEHLSEEWNHQYPSIRVTGLVLE
ncbi:MAG: FxLYD domain-containing protein [Candidatus Acidiferrales bacterium]|jgi:hypothetical protein